MKTIEQLKKISIREFMELSPLERKLIDELNRMDSQLELLENRLKNSRRSCENLRESRDGYRRQLGVSSDLNTIESVREKYDPHFGG